MVAQVARDLHITMDEAWDTMLADLEHLQRSWAEVPPLHMMVGGYFGLPRKIPTGPAQLPSAEELDRRMRLAEEH